MGGESSRHTQERRTNGRNRDRDGQRTNREMRRGKRRGEQRRRKPVGSEYSAATTGRNGNRRRVREHHGKDDQGDSGDSSWVQKQRLGGGGKDDLDRSSDSDHNDAPRRFPAKDKYNMDSDSIDEHDLDTRESKVAHLKRRHKSRRQREAKVVPLNPGSVRAGRASRVR